MRALVTGGGGFLGGAIIRRLLDSGTAVRSFSRGSYPELAAQGVECMQGDLADSKAIDDAARGVDVVYHVAAKAGVWGPYEAYHRANVIGTENVIAACATHGVGRLVYTSTPSVVFNGRDIEGGDESLPYADRFDTAYPKTKAIAEQMVLRAHGDSLRTVALRPHLIWGPGDNHLVPRIVARGRAGQLRRIGSRPCRVDSVYVDNAADAHLLAARQPTGRPYFISNDEPLPVWELINRILEAAGVEPVTRMVPVVVASTAGALLETAYRLLGIAEEPRMTRFVAHQLSTAHWFDISAARRDFGYQPAVSIDEGLVRLAEWLRD